MMCSVFVFSRRAGNWSLLCLPHNRNLINSKEVGGRSRTRQEEGVRMEATVKGANLKDKNQGSSSDFTSVHGHKESWVRSLASTGLVAVCLESQLCGSTAQWLFLAA